MKIENIVDESLLNNIYKDKEINNSKYIEYVEDNIKKIYNELEIEEFQKVLRYYKQCLENSINDHEDLESIFIKNKIPYVMASEIYNNINKEYLKNRAKASGGVEALYYIDLIVDKYNKTNDIYLLRTKYLLDLKLFEEAIEEIDKLIDISDGSEKVDHIIKKVYILIKISKKTTEYDQYLEDYILESIEWLYKNDGRLSYVTNLISSYLSIKDDEEYVEQKLKTKSIPYILVKELGKGDSELSRSYFYKCASTAFYDENNYEKAIEYANLLKDRFEYYEKESVKKIKETSLKILNKENLSENSKKQIKISNIINNKLSKNIRKKNNYLVIIIVILSLLFVGSFLFKTGIIDPIILKSNTDVLSGDYILSKDKEYENYKQYVVEVDEKLKIDTKIELLFPINGKEPIITYKSKEPDIIEVNDEGELKALKEGQTEIMVMKNGKPFKNMVIKVIKVKVTGLDIRLENHLSKVGDSTYINAIVKVNYDFNRTQDVIFSSSDESIVKVSSNGKIEAVGKGLAYINVRCQDIAKKIEIEIK